MIIIFYTLIEIVASIVDFLCKKYKAKHLKKQFIIYSLTNRPLKNNLNYKNYFNNYASNVNTS